MNRRLSPHSQSFQLATFAVLAAVMLVTRTHSLSNLVHLPETSLASFFVLGYLVRQPLGFAALFLLAFGIDVVTINVLGGSGYCYTPAYAMLVPAYGVMWFAGRFAAARFGERLTALVPTAAVLVGAAVISNVLSSGGYYVLSGRFDAPTIAGYLPRFQRYFPGTLLATLLWSGLAAVVYAVLLTTAPQSRRAGAR
jgi:hypothetical protein